MHRLAGGLLDRLAGTAQVEGKGGRRNLQHRMLEVALTGDLVPGRNHFAQHMGMMVRDPAAGEEGGVIAGFCKKPQHDRGAAHEARIEAIPVRARYQRAECTDLEVVLDGDGEEAFAHRLAAMRVGWLQDRFGAAWR